jgi:hypothetical protein
MQHDFILLDRSGSMAEGGRWPESLNAINEYVKNLAEDKVDTAVTLAAFDLNEGKLDYAVLRNDVEPSKWEVVSEKEASPRGWTPLNDAIGKMVGIAKQGNYDKCAIIVMTDGHENSSKEVSVSGAKGPILPTSCAVRRPAGLLTALADNQWATLKKRSARPHAIIDAVS